MIFNSYVVDVLAEKESRCKGSLGGLMGINFALICFNTRGCQFDVLTMEIRRRKFETGYRESCA
jgi:hypothetical protein